MTRQVGNASILLAILLLLIFAISAQAADPATQPSAAVVSVQPFTQTGPNSQPWVGDGIQRALVSDLARIRTLSPAMADTKPADARYTVTGSYQIVGDELRIVGQVTDARTRRVIAGLKATGSQRDLFGLEDAISAQASRALAKATGFAPEDADKAAAQAARIEPSGPVVMRPYDGSSLEESLRPDATSPSNGDYARYMYGNYGYAGYGYPYHYGYPYGGPTYGPYYPPDVDYGYYPYSPSYYPSGVGSQIFIFSGNRQHADFDRSHHVDHFRSWGWGSGRTWHRMSLPSGNIVTPRQSTIGSGHSNGYIPMTMQGGLRNYNGAMRNYNAPTR